MNKRGEGEMFILFLGLMLILGLSSAIENSNPYTAYVEDCKKINYDKFHYNSTCMNTTLQEFYNGERKYIDCEKRDKDKLLDYCNSKWNDVNVATGEGGGK